MAQPNTTIYLASNVDMDLSGEDGLYILQGVTIIGGEPCQMTIRMASSVAPQPTAPVAAARMAIIGPVATPICGGRTAQEPGPRLYTTTRPNPLLQIRCDSGDVSGNVRLEGFRIQGPDWEPTDGSDLLERGIVINSCTNVDIGNMELSGWSDSAIRVLNDANIQTDPDAVHVHDSFIHHNQHLGSEGYGVDVSVGGWATVSRNVFDFNRHAVTHGLIGPAVWRGGYTATQNLVLKGGGYHGKNGISYVQQFDVHGNYNCVAGLIVAALSGVWNCGESGVQYNITQNAFQYTSDKSFLLRGTPKIGAFLSDNVFPKSQSDSVGATDGTSRLYLGSNTTNFDSFGNYGVCDFNGDGHDDLFLATGNSWWYMSSAKSQWTYLNSDSDTIDQLAFGDFEGTGGCDVFAVHGDQWVISRGGTGPWQSLGTFGVPFSQLRFGHFTGSPRTEIFRRDPTGQWSIISPGFFGWTPLQSSSLPLDQLRFGDFNGKGTTDVVASVSGQWMVSWGGRTTWQPLNPNVSDSLASTVVADLDGKGTDDIIRYNGSTYNWEVSVGGRTTWQQLVPQGLPDLKGACSSATSDGSTGAQLLTIGGADFPFVGGPRRGHLYSRATSSFTPYGMYAY